MHDADEADVPRASLRARLSRFMSEEVRVPRFLPQLAYLALGYILVGWAVQDALFWVIAAPYVIGISIVMSRSLRHHWQETAISTGRHIGFRLLRLMLGKSKRDRTTIVAMILITAMALLKICGIPS